MAPGRGACQNARAAKSARHLGSVGRTVQDILRRMLGQGEALEPPTIEAQVVPTPTLWLLGKTGSGKSSLIRLLTGEAEIGPGFAPCTRTAMAYDFPRERPLLRFLDTRGLGEVGYDPADDLAAAEEGSHAIVALARLDDPVQGAVTDVVAAVRDRRPRAPILLVHTGADLAPEPAARERARARAQAAFEEAAGGRLAHVVVALPPGAPEAIGVEELHAALAAILPETSLLMMRERAESEEARRFAEHRPLVLWYAGAAAAADTTPIVGAVSVPALQGAMLNALAQRYRVPWTRARIGAFAGALGSGVLLRYAAGYAARQGAKLVPGIGQTLGAAAAATVSFAATYALGRAACFWLDREARGEPANEEVLRRLYAEAFKRARHAPR